MSYNLPRILNNLTHDVTHVNPETDIRITSLEVKTENFTASITSHTSITGNLDINPSSEILNESLFEGVQDQLVSASDYSYGMKFTILQPISIIRLGIWLYHWRVSVGNLTIKFWKEGDNVTPISTSLIAQIITYQPTSYFYTGLVTPILLPVGTYRMSTGYKAGMFYNGALTLPFTYPSQILNIQSAYSTSPNGAYPTNLGTDDISAGGYFWFDTPPYSNINVTTLNTSSSLVCPEIKTLASEIGVKNHINMNSNNLTNVGLINGSRVHKGGVFTQTSTFSVSGVISESNLISAGGIEYGSIITPANGFSAGDTFLIKIGGVITCASEDTFTIRIRMNYIGSLPNSPSPVLAIFSVKSVSALTDTPWNVEATCSLRDLGVTATMFTDARFSYFDSSLASGALIGVGYNGSTIINTTIENRFGFTYQSPKNTTIIVANTLINKLY